MTAATDLAATGDARRQPVAPPHPTASSPATPTDRTATSSSASSTAALRHRVSLEDEHGRTTTGETTSADATGSS